jgi:hypothetical protein
MRPDPISVPADHSVLSSYREVLLEHLFVGEVMRHVWLFSGTKRLEVLKPQVDDGGYDLVLEASSVVRHVQLKATFEGSSVRRFNINANLAQKRGGCVICMKFDEKTLDLGPFYWLGGAPDELPDLGVSIAKHAKGNAQGVKSLRPNIRVVPLSAFTLVPSIAEIAVKLFGAG